MFVCCLLNYLANHGRECVTWLVTCVSHRDEHVNFPPESKFVTSSWSGCRERLLTEGGNRLEILVNLPVGGGKNNVFDLYAPSHSTAFPSKCHIKAHPTRQASSSAIQETYLWEYKWDTGTSCYVLKLHCTSPQITAITFIQEAHRPWTEVLLRHLCVSHRHTTKATATCARRKFSP